jgi:hypothetical protein
LVKAALLGTTAYQAIEIWFQDEARVGQQGSLEYVWAPIGARPLAVRDNRHDSVYLFGFAVLRHRALKVMQKDASEGSFRGKLKRAGWDDAYLSRLLALF